MNDKDKAIILSFAECKMRVTAAAKKLFYNPNTVRYHLKKIRSEYGLNPFSFYDLYKLTEIAKR